ncbi:MAG: hypothetical protein M0Z66_04130 [Thermaerobacter sp.]|nr:hypothetical protein [Thermaerobacter sp.]
MRSSAFLLIAALGCLALCGCAAAASGTVARPATRHSRWSCAAPTPPVSGAVDVVRTGREVFGGQTLMAAAFSPTGCLTFYATSRTKNRWSGQPVTASATRGDGIAALQMFFSDRMHGWILAFGFLGAFQTPIVLFRTVNGGAVWQRQPAKGSPFPEIDEPIRMRFENPRDGWITSLNGFASPPRVGLYHTTDGGDRWTFVSFSLPARYQGLVQEALPPVFSNSAHGMLRLVGTENGQTSLLYSTDDGGETWRLDSSAGP